jgi:hypothetical protein
MNAVPSTAMAAKKKAGAKTKAKARPKVVAKARGWSTHPIMPTAPENERRLARLRKLCLALPGTSESINHGRPCFVVDKRTFVMFLDNHHRDERVAIWCKAPPGAQTMIVESDPERFFVPPYVGPSGWIGARLDRTPDWGAIRALIEESYAMTAKPKARARAAKRS